MLRPVVSAFSAVPFFFTGVSLAGAGLTLEVVALLGGILLGILACIPLYFTYQPRTGQVTSRAGVAYTACWVGLSAAKIALTYSITTWWPHLVGTYLMAHHIPFDAVRTAFIVLSLGSR
ncbi:MAG: hypothetical protein ACRDMV_12900 [Streptosporangiales bacterium]